MKPADNTMRLLMATTVLFSFDSVVISVLPSEFDHRLLSLLFLTQSALSMLSRLRLRWHGHIERHPENSHEANPE